MGLNNEAHRAPAGNVPTAAKASDEFAEAPDSRIARFEGFAAFTHVMDRVLADSRRVLSSGVLQPKSLLCDFGPSDY